MGDITLDVALGAVALLGLILGADIVVAAVRWCWRRWK